MTSGIGLEYHDSIQKGAFGMDSNEIVWSPQNFVPYTIVKLFERGTKDLGFDESKISNGTREVLIMRQDLPCAMHIPNLITIDFVEQGNQVPHQSY